MDTARRAEAHRDGIRHARRASNWTAAALVVGTGAAAVALAHQALPATAPTAGTAAQAAGAGAGTGGPASLPGAGAPRVTHSVATTSASGVTTTTTQTVNGQTIVTRVRTAPAHGDD